MFLWSRIQPSSILGYSSGLEIIILNCFPSLHFLFNSSMNFFIYRMYEFKFNNWRCE